MFLSTYLKGGTNERACFVVKIDISRRPRDAEHTPRSSCQRNFSPLHITIEIAEKRKRRSQWFVDILVTFHSCCESADKSSRDNDTGYFFVKESEPVGEVYASVGYHRDEGAACSNITGAYLDDRGDFLRIYNVYLCQLTV